MQSIGWHLHEDASKNASHDGGLVRPNSFTNARNNLSVLLNIMCPLGSETKNRCRIGAYALQRSNRKNNGRITHITLPPALP